VLCGESSEGEPGVRAKGVGAVVQKRKSYLQVQRRPGALFSFGVSLQRGVRGNTKGVGAQKGIVVKVGTTN